MPSSPPARPGECPHPATSTPRAACPSSAHSPSPATGALLSMASKDRAVALGLRPAPERALGWLLGGRDGRLLLVAVGALLGAPLAALAAVTATSALSLGLRVVFLRRPPAT